VVPQKEQRQRQDQDKEDFQEAMLWVWQGGSLHYGCPNIKVRRRDTNKNDKNKKKEVGEAHLGE
jgi:hypothetical protein